jgi:hypothetical protein
LEAVAAGAISPSEASVLLDAVAAADDQSEQTRVVPVDEEQTEPVEAGPDQAEPAGAAATTAAANDATPARTPISATLNGGPILIECRPDIDRPYADGPASVRIDGDAATGYTVDGSVGDDSAIVLPADIDLRLEGNGSHCTLSGINGTLGAALNVGDIEIEGRLAAGESRIEANAGDLQLRLLSGSDVEIITTAPADIRTDGLQHIGRGRWAVGAGAATCEVSGNLGTITITAL